MLLHSYLSQLWGRQEVGPCRSRGLESLAFLLLSLVWHQLWDRSWGAQRGGLDERWPSPKSCNAMHRNQSGKGSWWLSGWLWLMHHFQGLCRYPKMSSRSDHLSVDSLWNWSKSPSDSLSAGHYDPWVCPFITIHQLWYRSVMFSTGGGYPHFLGWLGVHHLQTSLEDAVTHHGNAMVLQRNINLWGDDLSCLGVDAWC